MRVLVDIHVLFIRIIQFKDQLRNVVTFRICELRVVFHIIVLAVVRVAAFSLRTGSELGALCTMVESFKKSFSRCVMFLDGAELKKFLCEFTEFSAMINTMGVHDDFNHGSQNRGTCVFEERI